MNQNSLKALLEMLQSLPRGKGYGPRPMDAGEAKLYSFALSTVPMGWAEGFIPRLCLSEPFLPSPAELMRRFANAFSPSPTAEEAFAEVWEKRQNARLVSKPHPLFPERYPYICSMEMEFETPAFSHPLVSQALRACGGWQTICDPETLAGVLKAQYIAAYRAVQGEFEQAVIEALPQNAPLEPGRRDPRLFPAYTPHSLPFYAVSAAPKDAAAPPPVALPLQDGDDSPAPLVQGRLQASKDGKFFPKFEVVTKE